MYNSQERRNMIMDHYQNPRHKQVTKKPQIAIHSNRCVDKLFINYQMQNKQLKNIIFDGEGCAIFLASTDIVIDNIKNKNLREIDMYLKHFLQAIEGSSYDEILLKEASIFDNVKKHLNRFDCAKMIYDGIQELILQVKNHAS